MIDEYVVLKHKINELFCKPVNKSLKELKNNKSKYYKYVSLLYYHFYYSTLTEDTILSPCNLIIKHCFDNSLDCMNLGAVNVTNTKTSSFINISENNYNIENHPVVSDLKIFLDNCHPYVEHNDSFILSNTFIDMILPKLSMYDTFYLQYLFELAKKLNYIKILPSILSSKSQLTNKYYTINEINNEQLFINIVDTSIEMAIDNLNFYLPADYFNKEKIISLFTNPVKTDDIFANIYSYYSDNFDMEDIIYNNFFYDDVSDTVEDKMDGFLKSLNYNFFTVFSYFLKIVRPIYVKEFDIESALSFIIYNSDDNHYFDYALFDIAYEYSLTTLGEKYFNFENVSENNFLSYENTAFYLFFLILLEKESDHLSTNNVQSVALSQFYYKKTPNEKVYSLKVTVDYSKNYWKTIDILGSNTLGELHFIICDEFSCDTGAIFSFFLDESESPFLQYSSHTSKNKNNKTPDKVNIHSLNLEKNQAFHLVLYNTTDICTNKVNKTNKVRLNIEVLNISDVDNYFQYPCISKESKVFMSDFN